MASSKNKTKKQNDKRTDFNIEIVGIIVISLGILSMVSMYSNSTGAVGRFIKSNSMILAGFGGYIFPCIILVTGFFAILNKVNYIKKSLSLIIIYMGFLTILDINYFIHSIDLKIYDVPFLDRLGLAMEYGKAGKGGGLIGSFISNLSLKLFGTVGSYIIIASIILISILIFTNVSIIKAMKITYQKLQSSIKSFFIFIKDLLFIKNKDDDRKKKHNKNNIIENETIIDNNIDNSNNEEIEQKIRILDYTKSNDTDNNNSVENDINNSDELNQLDFNEYAENPKENYEHYNLPSLDMLNEVKNKSKNKDKKEVLQNANKLIETLSNFGINANITQVSIGPSITRYELQPAPGVKVSKIVGLSNDIALSLASSDLRMEAPIPGKSAIGIEVPNKNKINVYLREIMQSDEYVNIDTNIPLALGKDIAGKPIISNIEKMPHLLIAGATGSGKSVCINTLIISILYKSRPDEVKLLMIDPKVVELSVYNGIPHLLIPVVTDPKKAASALNWAVQEMTRRYNLFAQNSVRDITSYNNKAIKLNIEKLPQLVVIIDELADLMMVSASEVEDYICRLAQMARAAGIHLIVATQRPSVDIITGTIKANIPSRISFAVSSQADSRTILDMGGAEKLLGKGDMLYYPSGVAKPIRVQGAYINEEEVERVVEFLKSQCNAEYKKEIISEINSEADLSCESGDVLLPKAIELVINEGQASISFLQRKLKIGYARAARLIDEMEERGVIGGYEGSKPRKVLISKEEINSQV